MASVITGCGSSVNFGSNGHLADNRSGDANPATATAQDSSTTVAAPAASSDTTTIQDLRTDTFDLPGPRPQTDTYSVNSQPFKEEPFTQTVAPPHQLAIQVLPNGPRTASLNNPGPTQVLDPTTPFTVALDSSHVIDLYVTVDNSKSFMPDLEPRVETAINTILTPIANTNWELHLAGGLNKGGSVTVTTLKASQVTATNTAASQVHSMVTTLLNSPNAGDRRLINAQNTLFSSSAPRAGSLLAFVMITDAVNCQDQTGAYNTSVCGSATDPTQMDEWQHLQQKILTASQQNMATYLAVVRLSNNYSVCSNIDTTESPNQYVEEATAIQATTDGTAGPFSTDLCAASFDGSNVVSAFASEIATLSEHRFTIGTTAPTVFTGADNNTQHPGSYYNFQVNGPPAGTAALLPGTAVVVINNTVTSGTAQTQYYNKPSGYDTNDYGSLFVSGGQSIVDASQPVTLTWTGNATPLTCTLEPAFTGSETCRYTAAGDFHLQNSLMLPFGTLTVAYTSKPNLVSSATITAASAIILNTVQLVKPTGVADSNVITTSTFADGTDKSLTVNFSSDLTPTSAGSYMLVYQTVADTTTTYALSQAVVSGTTPICYDASAKGQASLGEGGVVELAADAASAQRPCQVGTNAAGATTVTVTGMPPGGGTSESLLVGYNAVVYTSMSTFTMKLPPTSNDTITVTIQPAGGGAAISPNFTVNGLVVTLTDRPLAPGEQLTLSYIFQAPLATCYQLTGQAFQKNGYTVTFGDEGQSLAPLDASHFDMKTQDDKEELCLHQDMIEPGKTLQIAYEDAYSSQTLSH